MAATPSKTFHPAGALLAGAGGVFLAVVLGYNEILLSWVDPSPPLRQATRLAVRRMDLEFGLVGGALVAVGILVWMVPVLRRLTRAPGFESALLLALSVFMPLVIAERGLAPWIARPPVTSLYLADSTLGWRHRPGAVDWWEGVQVRINGKGLRGPELPYDKPDSATRLLYLGDSVTFGDKLPDDSLTYPYRVEAALHHRVARPVETINAGVSGYSPWQELAFLRDEGLRYDPDVVVVGFVLNDVTEKFELLRFGGSWQGWQLGRSPQSAVRRFLLQTNIVTLGRRLMAQWRLGSDLQQGAQERERLNVRMLVDEPDAPIVSEAWSVTLENLSELAGLARARGIPAVLVVFPFTFQFDRTPDTAAPQRILREFAAAHGIHEIDLLPVLRMRATEAGVDPSTYFVDTNHLSPLGARVVGEAIADSLVGWDLVPVQERPT